ncbi:MAG: hypothetical protein M3Q68_05290 [Actinomycetota bacterium]|nr:hypothetical protein [Actinomycetota bacterium]
MPIRRVVVVLSFLVVSIAALPAGAVHWPQFGGDAGRSGAQPVDQGGVPIELLYSVTGPADRDVRTSVITTAGPPAAQRLAYGTEDGFLLQRLLVTGAPIGPAGGIDLGADPFPFGSAGSVSFVESSTAATLGQIYAVHNELYADDVIGLELAQIDEITGTRARDDIALPGTIGYRIQSSPLLTAADAAGNRTLFFVAEERAGTNQVLVKMSIGNAGAVGSTIGAPIATADVNANAAASPTLVFLNNGAGSPTAYVAVATLDGVRTFAVADLAPGPISTDIGEPVRTPSVPVTASGNPPGTAGSGLATAPAFFAASGGSSTTTVHRFTQTGNDQVLSRTASIAVVGEAAPALAVSADGQRLVVTTSKNLYGFRTTDLALVAKYNVTDDLAATTTGFSRTTAVTTGAVVFVVTDGGQQLALERDSLQPVDADLFAPARAADGSRASFGQPSISRRILQVTTDRGLFVYGLRRAAPPTGYWLAASDGGIFTYGDAGFFGSTGDLRLNRPIVTMASTPTEEGYWLAASDGGIFAFGDAGFFGSAGNLVLNSPVVGMVPTRSGLGYWLVAADGGVFTFGDATFLGSMGDVRLNKPIVGMAATATGDGYYLVASDGGIFTFGDAVFLGSTGDLQLNKPIVGMAAVPAGNGYWLVASDGGVFAFGGRAGFFGSTGDLVLNSPIVAIAPSATGQGYLFTAADGGVFVFGDAPFLGSAAELGRLNQPVVTLAAKP